MLVFEPIYTDGLAQISYLVGDSKAAVAAVIDPRRDIDVYLDLAREKGLRIAYAIETHIHADFVSGAQALAERSGAEIIGGCSPDYGFELRQAADGEVLELGQVSLEIIYSPGHTPEHISLLLRDGQQGDEPFALFTGDTLFNLDVGRPDLLGEDSTKQLAAQLYATLFTRYLPLGERVEIYRARRAASPLVTAGAPHWATSYCSIRHSTSGATKPNSSTGCSAACPSRRVTTRA
jgi:hydroxyacylglutathione hydrolase